MGDGPELSQELLARLGPRHDLQLRLRDFDVVFTVRVESPNHINIEEGIALIRYLKWVLRSTGRFRHRVVLLIDSKVVLGADTAVGAAAKACVVGTFWNRVRLREDSITCRACVRPFFSADLARTPHDEVRRHARNY